MPEFNVDTKAIAVLVWEELQLDAVKDSVKALKGIDWNPFDEDNDAYMTVWDEIQHNWALIWDVALKVVQAVQRVIVGVGGLANPQKHAAVVKVLDDLIRAPWYVEPFDSLALDILVKSAVEFMRSISWGVDMPQFASAPIPFREVG